MEKHNKTKLCNINDCTGCMACKAVCNKSAITIYSDNEGFFYPQINQSLCISCGVCQKACSVLNKVEKFNTGKVYAAWSLNNNIRETSSSGGLFSVFAEQIIYNQGIIVGATLDNNGFVKHIIIDNINDLYKIRGSKYVQSLIPTSTYKRIKEYLVEGRIVLFCGTPCQIAAIRNVYKKYENLLYTIDLVCHGVPSPTFFSDYFHNLKKKYPHMISFQFRDYKRWLVSPNINIKINGDIRKRYIYGKQTFYQSAFLKGYLHRKNCYNCQYCTIQRIGDITLADFWGIGRKKPIHGSVNSGVSMVSINSDKGKILFNKISKNIFYEERDIQETIDGGNEQLVKPSKKPFGRESFYNDFYSHGVSYIIRKYKLKLSSNSFIQKLFIKIVYGN